MTDSRYSDDHTPADEGTEAAQRDASKELARLKLKTRITKAAEIVLSEFLQMDEDVRMAIFEMANADPDELDKNLEILAELNVEVK